jgi:hypothetical protein
MSLSSCNLEPLKGDKENSVPEIKPGSVIHSFSNQAGKIKRIVVLALNQEGLLTLTAYFNTKKPFMQVKKLAELQFHLKADGNNFLDHDSFINCAHPEIKPLSELQNTVKSDPKSYLGDIDYKKLDEIITMVSNAYTVSKADIKKFGLTDYIIK